MRSTRCTGVLLAAIGALLAGCSAAAPPPEAAGAAGQPPAPSTSASAPSSADTAAAPSGAGHDDDRCRLDDLTAERRSGPYSAGENQVLVVWTNRSGRTCTMNGFGGVDLVDAAGRRLSAVRSEQARTAVSLEPGRQAHSTLRYPAAGGTGVFAPRTMLATPPDETRSATVAWGTGGIPTFEAPGRSDQLQITPVQPGAS